MTEEELRRFISDKRAAANTIRGIEADPPQLVANATTAAGMDEVLDDLEHRLG